MKLAFLGFGKIATHHANAFLHLGCEIVERQSISEGGNALGSKADAIIVCLHPEHLPEYIDKIMADPRPCLIEKCLPVQGPKNKICAFNRRHYETVRILRDRIAQGGLIDLSADLPPCGAQMHGFDLLLHLFGAIHATTVKGSMNVKIRAIFDDSSVWTLSPFERLTVQKGAHVEGTEYDNIRRYDFAPRNVWNEDAEFKPGFLQQARSFMRGCLNGKFGVSCTLEENARLYATLKEMQTTKPRQYSEFTWRRA